MIPKVCYTQNNTMNIRNKSNKTAGSIPNTFTLKRMIREFE